MIDDYLPYLFCFDYGKDGKLYTVSPFPPPLYLQKLVRKSNDHHTVIKTLLTNLAVVSLGSAIKLTEFPLPNFLSDHNRLQKTQILLDHSFVFEGQDVFHGGAALLGGLERAGVIT